MNQLTLNPESKAVRGVVASPAHASFGQHVTVDPADIRDWLYIYNLRLIGGASVRSRVVKDRNYGKSLDRYCQILDESSRNTAKHRFFDAISDFENDKVAAMLKADPLLSATKCEVVYRWAPMGGGPATLSELSALDYSLNVGNEEVAVLLVNSGADIKADIPNFSNFPSVTKAALAKGLSPNTVAPTGATGLCRLTNVDAVKILLDSGADVNCIHYPVPDRDRFESPVCRSLPTVELAELLHQRGAKIDVAKFQCTIYACTSCASIDRNSLSRLIMLFDPANYDDERVLTEYVWHNHFSLLHRDEKLASRMIEIQTTSRDEHGREVASTEWVPTPTDSIRSLLEDGMAEFRKNAAKRIINDEQLTIARCSSCERIVRTPNAKQCL